METISEKIRAMIDASGKKMQDVAEYIGLQKSVFSNRLARNSFSADELVRIANFCGITMTMERFGVDVEQSKDYRNVTQNLGGKCYDTDNAVMLIRTCDVCGGKFSLFRDVKDGEHFIVIDAEWMAKGKIEPITREQALLFYRACGGTRENKIF